MTDRTRMLEDMPLGSWVAITEDGIWYSPFDASRWAYKRKSDLIEDIGAATLDARRVPKVRREQNGEYSYTVKDVDTGTDGETYAVYRVTAQNIEWLRSLLDVTEE